MAENTKIEWASHTFNAWIGCTKVSPACDNCYAEAHDKRFEGGVHWGAHAPRRKTSAANWKKPLKWQKDAAARGVRERVFCASLADVFDNHKSIEPEWREELWALIRATPNLDWLLLTKRPMNVKRFLPDDWDGGQGNLFGGYPNVWIGTTVENQEEAVKRIPHLLQIQCAGRFLSCEPLLGCVELDDMQLGEGSINCFKYVSWEELVDEWRDTSEDWEDEFEEHFCISIKDATGAFQHGIDWVICGGENHAEFRHTSPHWVSYLRDQCKAAGVPFLFKQWGGRNRHDINRKGRYVDGILSDEYPIFGGAHG